VTPILIGAIFSRDASRLGHKQQPNLDTGLISPSSVAGSFESCERLSTDLGASLDSSVSGMASDAAPIVSCDAAGGVGGE
jgi:hypothetical protein